MKHWHWFALSSVLAVCVSTGRAAPVLTDTNLTVTAVVTGLSVPTSLGFLGTNDFLVLEKNSGRVRRVLNGTLQPDAVLDLAVDSCGERGLLGIAVHPGFPTQAFVYLSHTMAPGAVDTECGGAVGTRISRFEWVNNTLTNPVTIFDFPVADGEFHIGGTLAFDGNGQLYAVAGDHNQSCELQNRVCANTFDDTSVIIRLNDDGSVPTDNPFFALGDERARYFAYGVRNSFGLAFDPLTGNLWDTENGPSDWDELNLVRPGFNSGWQELTGPDERRIGSSNNLVMFPGAHYADPQFAWRDVVAPTALSFVNSTALGAAHQNRLFAGDFSKGNLYRFELNAQRDGLALTGDLADGVADGDAELTPVIFGAGFGGISDLKTGPDGKLYVADIREGIIYVIAGPSAGDPGDPGDGDPGPLPEDPNTAPHDLAIASVKVPKKISLNQQNGSQTKAIKIAIHNLGDQVATIPDLTTLLEFVDLNIESLGGCPVPLTQVLPPKKGFPLMLAPKKKVTIRIDVTYGCANDPAKGIGHEDYRYTATLNQSALGFVQDPKPGNDACPRLPSATAKGCGPKGGGGILTDVVVK